MEPNEALNRAREWLASRGERVSDEPPTKARLERVLAKCERARPRPTAIVAWLREGLTYYGH